MAKRFNASDFFLNSTWVTSFDGFNRDSPTDLGHFWVPRLSTFEYTPYLRNIDKPNSIDYKTQSSNVGYVPFSTILCVRFLDLKHISGYAKTNRGGELSESDFDGPFTFQTDKLLRIVKGGFTTVYHYKDDAKKNINQNYHFIVKNQDEIEWIWMTSRVNNEPFRANVARGTLTRVPDLVGGVPSLPVVG